MGIENDDAEDLIADLKESLEDFIPANAKIVGTFKTKSTADELNLTDEHFAMLQKILDLAKERVQNNPQGEGVKAGAVCPNLLWEGRQYALQLSIELIPVDEKLTNH